MTDASVPPEPPNVADTTAFLRRFADLMSNGYNAAYLRRAADLIDVLTARVLAASDEEKVARYKYETVSHHADALEAECDALKHDIEGHLNISSSLLAERDQLNVALQSQESELSGLRDALNRNGEERASALETHEAALAGLRASFDGERGALAATAQQHAEEMDQLRQTFESEREQHAAKLRACEAELSEPRLAFDRERHEFEGRLKAGADELATLRVASQGESNALKAKIAALEAKRAELRAALDRIRDLRLQSTEPLAVPGSADDKPSPEANASPSPAQAASGNPAAGQTDAIVPKTTLLQARAQFEYLAREFIPLGDIASQVMCELGAYSMDLALTAGQQPEHSPVDEVALGLLASPGSISLGAGSNAPPPV